MRKPQVAMHAAALAALLCGASSLSAETASSESKAAGPQVLTASNSGATAKAKASASASASSSSSSSGSGEDCEASAKSSAEAVVDGKRTFDSDEKTARGSDEGCSASAHSRATVKSGDDSEGEAN